MGGKKKISVKSSLKQKTKERGNKGKSKSKLVQTSLSTGTNEIGNPEMSLTTEKTKERGEKGKTKSKTKFIETNPDGSHVVTTIKERGEKGKARTRTLKNNAIGRLRAKYIKEKMVRKFKKAK